MFFSRRIGLVEGNEVPIDIGGRVTGKTGPYSIGLIDIRTADVPSAAIDATNFGIVRVKRDVLKRSAVGVLYTDRSSTTLGEGHASTVGVDGVFSFFQNLNFNTYLAASDNPGTTSENVSYRAQMDYNADCLRPAARTPHARQPLHSRGRLHTAHGVLAQLDVRSLQPTAELEHDPEDVLRGGVRLHHRPGQPPRIAPHAGSGAVGTAERRRPWSGGRAKLRVPRPAVRSLAGRDHSDWRLRLQRSCISCTTSARSVRCRPTWPSNTASSTTARGRASAPVAGACRSTRR